MNRSRLAALALLLLMTAGCGMFGGGGGRPRTPSPTTPTISLDVFANRVWRVVQAVDVPLGTLYVFLSDNTLLVTVPDAATPALGRWHFAGGGLVLIEGGFRFPADIVDAGQERFVIRVHRPGGPVDIVMTPARESPLL